MEQQQRQAAEAARTEAQELEEKRKNLLQQIDQVLHRIRLDVTEFYPVLPSFT